MIIAGLEFCCVLLAAVLTGMHVAGIGALNPALSALPAAVFIPVKHELDSAFPKLARLVMLASLAAGAALPVAAAVTGRVALAGLAAAALISLVVTLLAILRGDLPLNRQMAAWSAQDPPPHWRDTLTRWEHYFAVRTAASVAALVLLTIAALLPR